MKLLIFAVFRVVFVYFKNLILLRKNDHGKHFICRKRETFEMHV
jgi:hypothetical protein